MSSATGNHPLTENHGINPHRCTLCNEHLSPPLRVLENGDIICARCPSQDSIRVKAIEAFLQHEKLPCRFKVYGCKQSFRSNKIREHEATCRLKPIPCFVLPEGTCSWKGLGNDVLRHFKEKHPQQVLLNIRKKEFSIAIRQEVKETVVIFQMQYVTVILYYNYDLRERVFSYCIRYICGLDTKTFYKAELTSSVDASYCFKDMYTKVEPYQPESPWETKVFHLDFYNNDEFVFLVTLDMPLDYVELVQLKCTFCRTYVSPPLSRTANRLVCFVCSEKRGLITVEEDNLTNTMDQLNYPCRWHLCNAIGSYDRIREHEKYCRHSETYCPVANCYITFKLSSTEEHFNSTHKDITKASEWFDLEDNSTETRQMYAVIKEKVLLINWEQKNDNVQYFLFPPVKNHSAVVCLKCAECSSTSNADLTVFSLSEIDLFYTCCKRGPRKCSLQVQSSSNQT